MTHQQHHHAHHAAEEFDLLAGHDLGDTHAFQSNPGDQHEDRMLVWQKIESAGFHPCAREGHSAVSTDNQVFIFGGFETGKRVNTTAVMDLDTGAWTLPTVKGKLPLPRSSHTAVSLDHFMVIHGGEAVVPAKKKANPLNSSSQIDAKAVLGNTVDGKDSMNMTKSSVLNVPAEEKTIDASLGVCPGDSIQCTKLGPAVRLTSLNTVDDNYSSTNMISADNTSSIVTCLDDMHVLDTRIMAWYPVKCGLAPLPRKGHTLNVIELNSKPHLLVFGGYSSENVTLSNTLLVCDAEKVREYAETCSRIFVKEEVDGPMTASVRGMRPASKEYDLQPVVWRTMQCKGTAPSPRYRHSATVVTGSSGEQLLVVIGGIGKDGAVALHDVFILDIDNLMWINLVNGHDALSKGLAGDGPVAGIFGHVCFPIAKFQPGKAKSNNQLEAADNVEVDPFATAATPPSYELLVFGGSANPVYMKSSCYSALYAFDVTEQYWRRVTTGHAFPNSRSNHSMTMVHGWAPTHEMPFASSAAARMLRAKTGKASARKQHAHSSSAVIFGGVGAFATTGDTWALDLQWRPLGVDQYDRNTQQRVNNMINDYEQNELQHTDIIDEVPGEDDNVLQPSPSSTGPAPHKILSINNAKYLMRPGSAQAGTEMDETGKPTLKKSLSVGNYGNASQSKLKLLKHVQQANSTASFGKTLGDERAMFATTGGSMFDQQYQQLHSRNENDMTEEVISEAVMQLRVERAQTDIRLQEEKSRNEALGEVVLQLTSELAEAKQSIQQLQTQHAQELQTLKTLLNESLQREQRLRDLNQEGYNLLTMFHIDHIRKEVPTTTTTTTS